MFSEMPKTHQRQPSGWQAAVLHFQHWVSLFDLFFFTFFIFLLLLLLLLFLALFF
jgi:hypothetical protein